MTHIDPIRELEYAVAHLEQLLDDYQYVHQWDSTATMAQTAIERLRSSIAVLMREAAQ
jgi:broad-specificity NMP kinase